MRTGDVGALFDDFVGTEINQSKMIRKAINWYAGTHSWISPALIKSDG